MKDLKISNKKFWLFGAIAIIVVVAGCQFYGKKEIKNEMPAINVTSIDVKEEVINNPKTYVALVEAINSVDVVAKVSGSLDKVNFKEGGFVKKDDALFVIDKDTYQAKYDLAKACNPGGLLKKCVDIWQSYIYNIISKHITR